MKKITQYQCEICGKTYDNERLATECEGRGKEEALITEGSEVKFLNEWLTDRYEYWETHTIQKVVCVGHKFKYELGNKYESSGYYMPKRTIYGNEEFLKFCKVINNENERSVT